MLGPAVPGHVTCCRPSVHETREVLHHEADITASIRARSASAQLGGYRGSMRPARAAGVSGPREAPDAGD